jgi:hypothetical protein
VTDSQERAPKKRRLPASYYNSITLLGAVLAALSLSLILFLMALETFSDSHSPYMGILAFVILPVFLIIGIGIGVYGVLRQQRRRKLGLSSTEQLPQINLNNPTHLRATVVFGGGFLVFLALSAFGSYQAYEYTESDAFCGTVCHAVMKPEYTAYSVSPHARVGCVECHIGSGAEWFVKAKISGLRQVYAVLFDTYSRPIETPIMNLRPSRDTCEQCHWPAHFTGEKMVVHDYYGYEDDNAHWRLKLLMKIGGGGAGVSPAHGIHWHMANAIDYVATDHKRSDIPWVRFVGDDGVEKIYRSTESDFADEDLATSEIRRMDCIDCHNRPTHHYNPPGKLVNEALKNNVVNPTLPGVKHLLVDLMEADYETEDEALAAIATGVRSYYQEDHPEVLESHAEDIDTAIRTAQRLFGENIFPEMKVSWREFPDNIGHLTTPGCFRCHDGQHETETGEVISRDCNVCHTIVAQEYKTGGELVSLDSVEYVHPEDIDGEWKTTNCSECHEY